MRRLDPEIVRAEIMVQLEAFRDLFGHTARFCRWPPACAVVSASKGRLSGGSKGGRARRLGSPMRPRSAAAATTGSPKALLLDLLSAQFRKRASRARIRFNPGFAGAYDFSRQPDFGELMAGFLDGLPEDGVVMCHPGFVDETLAGLDPFTVQREREYAYLGSEAFPRLLAANNVTLG